jgi:hypothetical protein
MAALRPRVGKRQFVLSLQFAEASFGHVKA